MTIPMTDLLGRPVDEAERELLLVYEQLKTLSAREDLPPCALMNARQAMVMMWNACADLNLVAEDPEDRD